MYGLDGKDLRDILDFTHHCYSYTDTKRLMESTLPELQRMLEADNGIIFFLGNDRAQPRINGYASINIKDAYSTQYLNYYWRYDPHLKEAFNSRRLVFKTGDVIPYSRWVKLSYYNNFLRPQNQYRELVMCLRSDERLLGVIFLLRAKQRPNFGPREIRKANIALRHITRALYNATLFSQIDEERNLHRQATELLPDGIILLDSELQTLHCNTRAKQACQFLSGKLTTASYDAESGDFTIPSVIREDCLALRRLFDFNGQPSSHSRRVIKTDNNKRFQIEYSLIRPPSPELAEPCFIICLKDLTKPTNGTRAAGIEKYGLTEREKGIAQYAYFGLTNTEIAEKLFISKFTVQNHLKSIFKKMGIKKRTRLASQMQPV